MRLHVLATGGSIDKEYTLEGVMEIGTAVVGQILRQANVAHEVTVESIVQKDSQELDLHDRDVIRERVQGSACRHVLITHGTDTMCMTAEHLLGVAGKVVVLTGSMQPARMAVSDAPFNIGVAVAALQLAADGVYIAMNGMVFPAGAVVKDRRTGRFVAHRGR